MAEQFLLRNCPVEELKVGMIVGRSIYDANEKELVTEGTKLTNPLIFSILDRPIYSIVIKERNMINSIVDHHVLDEGFVQQYDCIMHELRRIFNDARHLNYVDVKTIQKFIRSYFMGMVDGLKAINQVHNIVREDNYLLHHSANVAILAGVLGQWMKLKPSDVEDLILAGLLHDIGKTQIQEEILDKPGKLSEEEMRRVKEHSSKGFELLRYGVLKDKQNILFGILQHHERMDGSGYPARVGGPQICEFAKIIAIADVYDAMVANKVYAKKHSPFAIFNALSDDMITKLDTSYCVAFIKNICHSLNGNWVELSNGKRGKIIYIDESRIQALPVLQCENGDFIDLNTEKELVITKLLCNNEVVMNENE